MPVRMPYHSTMEKEIEKATKIINAFFDSTLDADSAIPADLIRQCAGLAFLTVIKAGMIWTGKIGTGVVVARLPNGSWSPPSGIGTAGVGFGAEFGGEFIDFMIVLGTATAVQTFKKGTQISLGAGLDLAVGPIGRTAGANVNASRGGFSGNYTYSHSKGMFAGVGLHGSTIVVRNDMNARFYGRDATPMEILNGHVEAPPGACDPLFNAIERAIASDAGGVFAQSMSSEYRERMSTEYQDRNLYQEQNSFQDRNSVPASMYSTASSLYRPASDTRPAVTPPPARSSSFDNNTREREFRNSGSNHSELHRTSSSALPPPSQTEPIENDPRLRRYGSYKSERELYAQFAKNKSTTDYSAGYGYAQPVSTVSSSSSSASASFTTAPASAPVASAAGYTAGYAAGYAAPVTPPAIVKSYAPIPPVPSKPTPPQVQYVPASTYAPYKAPANPAPVAPRAQAPPIPPPTSGAETKRVFMGVMQYVTTRCPHADLQLFKDNCRRFGQDQLSLDAYFAYLTSIGTTDQLKELLPQLVRLLPTQDKRENLWALYTQNVLWIR